MLDRQLIGLVVLAWAFDKTLSRKRLVSPDPGKERYRENGGIFGGPYSHWRPFFVIAFLGCFVAPILIADWLFIPLIILLLAGIACKGFGELYRRRNGTLNSPRSIY